MRRWLTLLVCLCALCVAAVASAKPSPLTGVYQTEIKSNNPQLIGTWQISFTGAGKYVVSKAPETKVLLIGGNSSVSGNSLTIVDKTGPIACSGAQATGKYTWSFSGKTLKFTKVKDTCDGRPEVLTTSPWSKIR